MGTVSPTIRLQLAKDASGQQCFTMQQLLSSIRDEHEDIQKKTFTKWINAHLAKGSLPAIEDLFTNLCDGKSLLALLEQLSGLSLPPEKGRMRVHHLNNVNRALEFLTDRCGIRLVNISSDDVVNGSPKLILGLVWSIILHWQVKKVMNPVMATSGMEQLSFEKTLLGWCQMATVGYERVSVQNFTTSWNDGFAFNALIHRFRPELFNYEEILAVNDSEYALAHAFQIAHEYLSIPKLLDPEDMAVPDKKSVMMYITCLYQALSPDCTLKPNSSIDAANQVKANLQSASANPSSSEVPPAAKVAKFSMDEEELPTPLPEHNPPSSSALTYSSNGFCTITPDLERFSASIESTLNWLLEAKDQFNTMAPIADDVEVVKVQFHEHEKFMLDLTRYQTTVGSLLTKGSTLVSSGELSQEQEERVRVDVDMLNREWEELRIGAMERQTSLQKSLMVLQQQQLEDLAVWLAGFEEQIKLFERSIQSIQKLEDVKQCVLTHQQLQTSLELQQEKVNSLQNMVVIVEDGVQDTAYQSMENMLQELGQRWASACKWVEDQWLHLQDVDVKWRTFHNMVDCFESWLQDKETHIGRMQLSDLSDPRTLVTQIHAVKMIEAGMDEQMRIYDNLNDTGQALLSYLPSFPQTTGKIQQQLAELKDRWDRLVKAMEEQSQRIAESGVKPEVIVATAASQRAHILDKFDALLATHTGWLDDLERTLRTKIAEETSSTLDEQLAFIRESCEEIDANKPSLDHMAELANHSRIDLGTARLNTYAQVTSQLDTCQDLLNQYESKVDLQKVTEELLTLEEILHSYSNWVASAPPVTGEALDIGKLAEQCRVKLKAMKHLEERVDKLYQARHSRTVVKAAASHGSHNFLAERICAFHKEWISVLQLIEDRQNIITQKLNRAPPRMYLDATEGLLGWLSQAEEVLAEPVLIQDVASMENNMDMYRNLQKAITDHVADVDYINKTGQDLVKRSLVGDNGALLLDQLASLNGRWEAASLNIDEKLLQLENSISNLKLFQNKLSGLNQWITDMETFLKAEQLAAGDMVLLEAQITQSDEILADIEMLREDITEANHSADNLIARGEEGFSTQLRQDVGNMNERWNLVVKKSEEQNRQLKDALAASGSILRSVSSLTQLFERLEPQIAVRISTTSQLLDESSRLRTVCAELASSKEQLHLLRVNTQQLMQSSRQDSSPNLLNTSARLESKYTQLQKNLDDNCRDSQLCSSYWMELQSLVSSNVNLLKELETKLQTGENQAVDAEDMAAEMDELESLLNETKARKDHQRYSELINWFEQQGFLIHEVSVLKENYEKKYDELIKQAQERVQLLDRASQQSEETEVRLTDLETWMAEINGLFREWNEQDLLAGDLPDAFQAMQEEFAQKDKFLHSVQEQIDDFNRLGKTQAAQRLNNKLTMIKDDYLIVQQNFLKWQRPVDFDPKLRRAQQQLQEINEKTFLVELYSPEVEHVRERLEQCTKYYQLLGDMKNEVEYVLKTGRVLVERRQVDFPKRVNQSLDALKSLYNKLGSHITQAKRNLEKAVKISTQLELATAAVNELLDRVELELSQGESTFMDIDKQIYWVKFSESEMEKVHPNLAVISDLHTQFEEFAETGALDEAKKQLEQIKDRWASAVQSLATSQRQCMARKSNIDAEYEHFRVKCCHLEKQLKALEDCTETNSTKLQAELQHLREEVSAAVSAGANISSKGDSYKVKVDRDLFSLSDVYGQLSSKLLPTSNMTSDISALANPVDVATPVTAVLSATSTSQSVSLSPVGSEQTLVSIDQDSFERLQVIITAEDADQYEVAGLLAACEANESKMAESIRSQFLEIKAEWNAKRDSTVQKWQAYELQWVLTAKWLSDLELKLDMASADSDLLKDIEQEIARRQSDINSLNEQAEELTERDTPPIDQRLLQLNQRWVGIRSRFADFKPASATLAKLNSSCASPPTKQKYEYAIINKNRTKQAPVILTGEVKVEDSSPAGKRRIFELELCGDKSTDPTSPFSIVSSPLAGASPGCVGDKMPSPSTSSVSPGTSKRIIMTSDVDQASRAPMEITVDSVRTLLSRISIVQQQLRSSNLDPDQYTHENFTTSDGLLKSVKSSIEALRPEVAAAELCPLVSPQRDLNEVFLALKQEWTSLNHTFVNYQSHFQEASALWTQFHALYKAISSWLDGAEKSLKKTSGKDGSMNLECARPVQKDLEEGMMHHQTVIHGVARAAISLAAKLKPADAERITTKVTTITSRWHCVTAEIRERKPRLYLRKLTDCEHWQSAMVASRKKRLESVSDAGKCLDVMDDLSFWIDETEIINTSTPNYIDEQNLKDALEKVKDRCMEVPYKREAMEFVSKSARDLWALPDLTVEDKAKIGRDMQKLSRKWEKVVSGLPDRQAHLEESLETLRKLHADIATFKHNLGQVLFGLSGLMDPENWIELKRMFPEEESVSMDTLSVWFREILLLHKKHAVAFPCELETSHRNLSIRWGGVKGRCMRGRADSDSSIEDVLATGHLKAAAGVDDIYDSPRQSVLFEDPCLPFPTLHSTASIEQQSSVYDNISSSGQGEDNISSSGQGENSISSSGLVEDCPPPPPRKESLQQSNTGSSVFLGSTKRDETEAVGRPEDMARRSPVQPRHTTLSLMRERLALLMTTIGSRRVDIINVSQISDALAKIKKLEHAVQEIMKQLANFEAEDAQVSGLRAECAECQVRSISRSDELTALLAVAVNYCQRMAQIGNWIDGTLAQVEGLQKDTHGAQESELANQRLKVERLCAETESWKDSYAALNRMTEDLLRTYPGEDTTALLQTSDSLNRRWNDIQAFLTSNRGQLESNCSRSDGPSVEALLARISSMDTVAQGLLEETMTSTATPSASHSQRFKDLQSEIDSHQPLIESVKESYRHASDKGISIDTKLLQRSLHEMNDRWTQLRAKTVQIRYRLENSMEQWAELIERCRQLIDWLTSRENELLALHPVGSHAVRVQEQIRECEIFRSALDSKTSEIEQTIATGRFYLEKEGADRRLSSASSDSKIMNELAMESNDAKALVKNIRRHIRLLNQKWLALHSKVDRWRHQLYYSATTYESVESVLNKTERLLGELEINSNGLENVEDLPVAHLPSQLALAKVNVHRAEEVGDLLSRINATVRQYEIGDGVFDPSALRRAEQLTARFQKAEHDTSNRIEQLLALNRQLVPETGDLLKDSVSKPYERATNPMHVPYYINHDNKTTQWDHPHMVNLMAQLPQYNTTKFSAYRTAQKLRKLQKALGLQNVRLKEVIKTCQGLKVKVTLGDELIDIPQVIQVLRELYENLVDERHSSGINIPLSIDLTLNWLLNVYDLGRQGQLRALSLQTGLVVMCRGAVEDKFNYLLSSLANPRTGMIGQRQLGLLLSDCMQIPRQVGEIDAFGGPNIDPSVQSCLEQAKGKTEIDTRQFMDWLRLEPQSMVWLPVVHRLATSESCRHQVKCSLCKTSPIVGLRYRCLHCFNFNICQSCFFTGKKGKSHKLDHPMKEYYATSTSSDEMKDLSSPMKKKYSSGRYIKKHHPKGYLPVQKADKETSYFSRESTPMSSPPSVNIHFDANESLASSHDGYRSHELHIRADSSNLSTSDDQDTHENIQRYASTLDRVEKLKHNGRNLNGNNANTLPLPRRSQNLDCAASHSNTDEASPASHQSNGTQSSSEPPSKQLYIDDEHKIIEGYCSVLNSSVEQLSSPRSLDSDSRLKRFDNDSPLKSPMQIIMTTEENQKTELEAMINYLEDENRNLQSEYLRLQTERDRQPCLPLVNGEREAEMLAEARMLRQHKSRLESRMKILEDHNKQLEAQLRRLRKLLDQPGDTTSIEFSPQHVSSRLSSTNSPLRLQKNPPSCERQISETESTNGSLSGSNRAAKLHGSIGELFQMAGHVGKAVGDLVSVVTENQRHSEA